ncbi:GntR family transcriptional regulator [Neomicrococcus lactis]
MDSKSSVQDLVNPRLSKAQLAYQWIKERISTHEFMPGHRLVLSTIADSLDISVVPVREAIRQLEAEGLVTFEKNIGAHVSMLDASAYEHSMETLGILEGAATALAAPFVTAEDIALARELNKQLETLLDDFDAHAFTEINHKLHQVLFDRCPNNRLCDLVASEWDRLGNLRESTFSFVPGRARNSVAEHSLILDAIAAGSPAAVIENLAREHRAATLRSYLASRQNTKSNSAEI